MKVPIILSLSMFNTEIRINCSVVAGSAVDTTGDPKCPSCEEEPQTVEHGLQRCPKAVALRHQLFGESSPLLSVFTTNPGSVLALARKTLL